MDYKPAESYNYHSRFNSQRIFYGTMKLQTFRWILFSSASLIFCEVIFLEYTQAQITIGGSSLGFAGADICTPAVINIPSVLKQSKIAVQGLTHREIKELPIQLEANEIQLPDNNLILLMGDAEVVQGNWGIFADEVRFNQDTNKLQAIGNIRLYNEKGDEITGDDLDIFTDSQNGKINKAEILFADESISFPDHGKYKFEEDYTMFAPFKPRKIPADDVVPKERKTYVDSKATAKVLNIRGSDLQVLERATLTHCTEGNDTVLLSARELELNHVSGIGTAKHMTVKFKKIPIFYFPRVSFPINNKRKTGFLFPLIGYENRSGMTLSVPYYINLAPQYDATLIPRILTKRGSQLYGEFRYLTPNSQGEIKTEFLPDDKIFGADRTAFSFAHKQNFSAQLRTDINLQDVSDTYYSRDFSNNVEVWSSTYIPQRASLTYNGDKISLRARASIYERINSNVSVSKQPYERIPDISLKLKKQKYSLFEYGLDSDLINYSHDDELRVDGTRLRLLPYISMPLRKIYGYITPKFSLQSIRYNLGNNPDGDASPSIAVPILSIDSGLYFEKLFRRPKNTYLQTLEPRLFYLNIPREQAQEEFPDFDTGGGSQSSFSHYFRENRFFGGDRVGDTHQVSLGLTSRLINDDSGQEKIKVRLGQVFYFKDREVGLTPKSAAQTENTSDFLLEFSSRLADSLSLRGFSRWSAEDRELEYLSVSSNYYLNRRRNSSLSYNRSKTSQGQVNIGMQTPLGPKWQFGNRLAYSIEDNEIRSAEIATIFDGCCWAVSLKVQRYRSGGEFLNRFALTVELDDLGKISSSF